MSRKMKDSGIDWIGQIPINWKIVKVKNLFAIGRGRVISQEELENDGTYPVFSSQTQNNGCLGYINTYDFDVKQLTWTTDGANAGTVFLREGKHNCTNVCGTLQLRDKNNNLEFLKYALEHIAFYNKRADTNGYKIMNNEMSRIKIIFPEYNEQTKIANSLDKKCSVIDKTIEENKKSIEQMEEYKKSLIDKCVTIGINGENKFKKSKIDWINQIPQTWQIKSLKQEFLFGKGLSITKENLTEKGSEVISYGQIHSKQNKKTSVSESLIRYVNKDYLKTNTQSLVSKNSFIFADTSEDLDGSGNFIYIDKNSNIFAGYHTIILRPIENKNTKYFAYLFQTDCWRSQIRSMVTGIKLFSITQKILKQTSIIIPPIDEQAQIVDYLDKKCFEIDNVISKRKVLIEKLEEYKKSLIYEAVTGKMEV